MDKLDKLKMASSSFGERLKTGGAQMSRIVSSKMKEILQAPTPESKMVDEATLETMEEPNWGLNLRICALINSEEFNGTEVVKAIKKKLLGKSPVSQRLSLDLLETCTSNCDKVFSEVASEKVLDDMMKLIDDPKTDHENRVKAMQLIRAWGESEDLMYLPVFHQTYLSLKTRTLPSGLPDGNMPRMQYPLETYMDQDPLSPPESYPMPDAGLHHSENATYNGYAGKSVEEKRESLAVTRNTLDLFSSILNSEDDQKPAKNELTDSMLENCKQSLPVIQGIVESTVDDEGLLFEALSIHDELQQIISRYQQMEDPLVPGGTEPKHGGAGGREPDASGIKEGSSLVQVQNQSETERTEVSKVESGSDNLRSVLLESGGVEGGAKERLDAH
ncbi:TOM1-like protein 2 [Coffea eugenioides]|uniref:TOM1-like protein 2 n=1 Tax=Coffea arabica TaxID=13443 RepID=A0A6P6V126_COFAR|nr:TOM1-like protein 2 [Coffea arabica]XP_027165128.1 TOM1-like protein 2 [Coffea eugenioides]